MEDISGKGGVNRAIGEGRPTLRRTPCAAFGFLFHICGFCLVEIAVRFGRSGNTACRIRLIMCGQELVPSQLRRMEALTWGCGMILVNCEGKDDYAIMKQIQQIKLIDPAMAVVLLKPQPNLSGINRTEKLYVVSHGATGDFFDGNGFGKRIRLLRYLTDDQKGVPQNFSGDIIILSCYGGKKPYGGDSIAEYIAEGLHGRAAQGTVVTGAIGYSFGTPEFRKSGRSSVLCDSAFYSLGNANGVVDAWLKLMPTHTEGILHGKLQIDVETNKTIRTLIDAKLQGTGETSEQAAEKLLTEFIDEAKGIEATLSDIIRKRIPGDTAAARADYLVNVNNAGQDAVQKWNQAIDRQYELYSDYYLWVPYPNGFTEPFPTWLCAVDLQCVDGFGELPGAPGAAAELGEDAPGLELGVRPLAG